MNYGGLRRFFFLLPLFKEEGSSLKRGGYKHCTNRNIDIKKKEKNKKIEIIERKKEFRINS